MAEFNWIPTTSSAGKATARVAAVQFGDGYEERSTYGINPVSRSWDLEFHSEDGADILKPLEAFLAGKAGLSFTWIQPFPFADQGELRWTCDEWNWMYEGARLMGLKCTFKRYFIP